LRHAAFDMYQVITVPTVGLFIRGVILTGVSILEPLRNLVRGVGEGIYVHERNLQSPLSNKFMFFLYGGLR